MSQQNNGFIYIGSLTKPYYDAAVMSAESVKDYWPEAKITLFTHEPWVNEKRDSKIFDKINKTLFRRVCSGCGVSIERPVCRH